MIITSTDHAAFAQLGAAVEVSVFNRASLWPICRPVPGARRSATPSAAAAGVDDVLARLVGLSLLSWGESGTSVIVHRLVARVVRDRARAVGTLAPTILGAARVLGELRIPERQAWSGREQGSELAGHTLAVWGAALDLAGDRVLTTQDLAVCAELMNWAVRHLVAVADLSRAINTGGQVLVDCERVLGAEHPPTRTVRENLQRARG